MGDGRAVIARANGLGDIGPQPDATGQTLVVNRVDPPVLFGYLELYRATRNAAFLDAARQVGDVILKTRFNHGLFVADNRQFASFNRIESLALLHLVAAIEDRPEVVPAYPGGDAFYSADYGNKGSQGDNFIYELPRRAK